MSRTLFTRVRILDCSGAAPFPGELLVDNDRILSVSRAAGAAPAPTVRSASTAEGPRH
ncbi:MAG: hypothetical protein U0903_01860 [Planctomycetales bacterium]